MKIVSVGDVHGRADWKLIKIEDYDLIVFVGDYVDSFICTDEQILNNLMDIIQLKKDYPDKVVLLLGNHDIQYRFLNEYGCSGFRPSMASSLEHLFKDFKDLFKAAHQVENTIWTHAGMSKGWFDLNKDTIEEVQKKFETKNLAETLNYMLMMNRNYNGVLHQVGRKRGGRYNFGGITWADRVETKNDYLEGYHQIVGHTPIERITLFGDEKDSIRYIDVMDEQNKERNFYKHEILVNPTQQGEIRGEDSQRS